MLQLNPYLNFNGQCRAAFKFYEKCFGGKIMAMITHGETPLADEVPPEWQSRIIHARLEVGDRTLMGSDAPPGRYEAPRGFSVMLGIDDPREAERVFSALAKNEKILMPIEQTFWAERFGMLVDQFAIPWMINCDKRGT